ncbi:MAG: hypothetical protein J6R49_03890 [Clostridia bacterium]|nr:hypothetical protein [Clostridia bacterium]
MDQLLLKSIMFAIFGLLSLAVVVGILLYSVKVQKKKERADRVFSPFQVFTGGVFIAVMLVFLPVFYYNYDLFGDYSYIRPIFIALHNTIRVFILDGDFDTVANQITDINEVVRLCFSFHSALLYVVAPILTFGNVLSMFKNIRGEAMLSFYKNRSMYIMSELNVCSMSLAESIIARCKENGCDEKKPIIVFTDVFEQNEEDDYELLVKAHDIGAICLKKDISHLKLSEKSKNIEIFLVGENESENIEHAIKLTECYKNRKNISIFVFATSLGAGYIIDSLEKGDNTLDDNFEQFIIRNPRGLLYEDGWKTDNNIRVDGGFYIRRINSIEALAKNTLSDENAYNAVIESAKKNDNTISIMIIGMGKYGKRFLKTAVWLYQLEGYKLEINVFDADKNGADSAKKQLAQECPELISINPSDEDGDANYDIKFFSGIDCFSSDFDNCFTSQENARRLKRTNLAFVTLGDDDKNIEAAVMLRALFDRIKHRTKNDLNNKEKYEMPIINAVVYDEQKASNLGANGSVLKNHKDNEYHVNFIGDMSYQFNYDNIEKNRNIEKLAFAYHIDWLRKAAQLRHCYENDPAFRVAVDSNVSKPIYWDDAHIYTGIDKVLNFDGAINTAKISDEAKNYVNYEYFRRSSIAKALHKQLTEKYFESACGHPDTCTCEICEARRKTEHMRWNAYMRSEGYVKGARNDRAKTHPNLCTWDELPYLDRFKD